MIFAKEYLSNFFFIVVNIISIHKSQLSSASLTLEEFLQTPQTPIVRTKTYEKYNIDDSPLGTNAIVAVLAYSG